MSLFNINPDCVEFLASDLQNAYPGLHETHYWYLAYEANHRHTGGAGGREWAMIAARLERDRLAEKIEPASDEMDAEYFS